LGDNPRARLLRYIAEHQPVSVKQIKTELGMSIGSIYHHLSGLGKLVAQDQHKHYMISKEGNAFLERSIESSYERSGKGTSNGSHDARSSGSSSHPRTLLLRFIASNGSVSIKQIKDNLGLNTGSIYHHLSKPR
jgi:predicted transcriptional regulator